MMVRRNFRTFFAGFGDAARGWAEAVRTQFNIRFHFVATILVLALSFYFGITTTEWCLIVLCIGLIWTAELLNTAVEYLTDFVSPEYNDLAGKVKDIAAAAVLLAAATTAAIGLIIFLPRITEI